MKTLAVRQTTLSCLLAGLALSSLPSFATTATWTSTADGTVESWTNAANWNAAQYPGQDAAYQHAYLTNRVAGAVYKATVDTSLPYAVGTIEIKNAGVGGEAWVIVTNAVVAATNLFIRTNGRAQIDNGGVVTNLPGGFTLDNTNAQFLVNSGGSLFAANNVLLGATSGGKSNVLSLGDNALFAITNGGLTIGNAVGADGNRLLVAGNNVRMRTTLVSVIGAAGANNLALFTGTNIVWDLGGNVQMRVGQSGGCSNTLMVSQGSLSLTGQGTLNPGLGAGSSYNALIVTNGAKLYTVRTVGAGYTTSNNLILVTGTGSLWDGGGAQEKSGDSGNANGNRIVVDYHGVVSNATVYIGTPSATTFNNSLLLANGAQWWGVSSADSMIGNGGTNNSAVVTGSGTLWNMIARTLYVGGANTNSAYSTLQVDDGAMITNSALTLGAGPLTSKNTVTVTNGGQFVASGTSVIGSSSLSNLLIITGAGSLWNGNVQALTIGNNAAAFGNEMRIENGGLMTNVNSLTTGGSGANGNRVFVTGGGKCYLSSGGSHAVGSAGASSNFTYVSGSASALSSAGNLISGNINVGITSSGSTAGATGNVFVVDNGAACLGWNQIYVGRYSYCAGNVLVVTNGGFLQGSQVRVAYQGSNTWNNSLQVYDGGLLEVSGSGFLVDQAAVGPVGNNCISNCGGIYQFTSATPTITPVPTNGSFVTLTDGTISFRGVTTVDVRANLTGNLTNILFFGTRNAFRLNSATNTTLKDQGYVFTDTLGPTNYARLELFNGSLYRNGSVTIGSGGTLALAGTPSTITNLTITSGGTLETTFSDTNSLSQLVATGSVALNGTLRLVLTAPPPAGFDWTLISKSSPGAISGGFSGESVLAPSFLGTNYLFRVDTSSGNALVLHSLGRSLPGTVLLLF